MLAVWILVGIAVGSILIALSGPPYRWWLRLQVDRADARLARHYLRSRWRDVRSSEPTRDGYLAVRAHDRALRKLLDIDPAYARRHDLLWFGMPPSHDITIPDAGEVFS